MSLKDSLASARERAERAQREVERERAVVQQMRQALADGIERTIQETADAAYQAICDRVADEIYRSGDARRCVEGQFELPDRLRVPIEEGQAYRDYRAIAPAASLCEMEPCLEEEAEIYRVRLTEAAREEIFWGYRRHLLLTPYGEKLVAAVRRQAAEDGISIDANAQAAAEDGSRRAIELSRSQETVRRVDDGGAVVHLVLRYRYEPPAR